MFIGPTWSDSSSASRPSTSSLTKQNERVAVDLARRREQEARVVRPRQVERVAGAGGADLERLERVREVLARARRARQVEHGVDGAVDGDARGDVVLDQREPGVVGEVRVVGRVAGEEVVDRDDLPLARAQQVAEVRTQEPRATGDHRSGHQRPTPR
jgi:hypothetical protein